MAGIAKRGNPQILFPEGVTTLDEVPWDLTVAISHSFAVLSWYENRPSEKIPPRWMWPHDEELEKFFDRVDDSGSPSEDDEEVAFENEFADRFK